MFQSLEYNTYIVYESIILLLQSKYIMAMLFNINILFFSTMF